MSKARNVIAGTLLLAGGAAAGRLTAPAEKVTVKDAIARESSAPTSDSALCFALGGLRRELGPEGSSSIRIFAAGPRVVGGELIVDNRKVTSAINSLKSALDPDSDGTVQITDANIDAIAAKSTAEAALPSVENEERVLGGLSNKQMLNGGGDQASRSASAMLDQARQQVDTALVTDNCDPNLYQQNPENILP